MKSIEAHYAKENVKSRRVMEKLGLHYKEECTISKYDGSANYDGETYIIEY